MNKYCRYLTKHKDYKSLDSSGSIYKCILANALLTPKDIQQSWACRRCIIPCIMNDKPCKYIKPHKYFPIRGSSYTWFSCELLSIAMDSPAEFCNTNCKIKIQNM